jgi:hypothetical protein
VKRLTRKRKLNDFIDEELLILLKALNVSLVGCNLKWSPLVGMLVQGLVEALTMIMIGMNLICLSKDCVKRSRVMYK